MPLLTDLFRRDRTEWLDAIGQPPEPPARGNGVDLYDFEEPDGARSEVGLDSSGNWRRLAVASGEGGSFPTSIVFQPRDGSRYRGRVPKPASPAPPDITLEWHDAMSTMPVGIEARLYEYRRAVDGAIAYKTHSGSSWGRFAPEAGLEAVTFLEERLRRGLHA